MLTLFELFIYMILQFFTKIKSLDFDAIHENLENMQNILKLQIYKIFNFIAYDQKIKQDLF